MAGVATTNRQPATTKTPIAAAEPVRLVNASPAGHSVQSAIPTKWVVARVKYVVKPNQVLASCSAEWRTPSWSSSISTDANRGESGRRALRVGGQLTLTTPYQQ